MVMKVVAVHVFCISVATHRASIYTKCHCHHYATRMIVPGLQQIHLRTRETSRRHAAGPGSHDLGFSQQSTNQMQVQRMKTRSRLYCLITSETIRTITKCGCGNMQAEVYERLNHLVVMLDGCMADRRCRPATCPECMAAVVLPCCVSYLRGSR